ncbi:hypothetical protein [Moorena sp. SIO3H5]|uniref:ParE family toxin-like protein n=1 Tax=Moorena sp. SIO3H5 TaxID=2607834 RepID=UPI0013BD8B9A|nr:hypothetical protein [Moorena sp. SIO3H5]NEO68118.1 hypothetical protein [Moorena sp. SIO3H5]
MKSFTTPDFWKTYALLPTSVKEQARKAYRIWQQNQFHPSLHFKKVGNNLWSVRITLNYRALAIKKGNDYYWIWIGTHDEYQNLINS